VRESCTSGGRRGDPARALRRGDRRADRGRLDHGGLLPQRGAAAGRGDRAHRARRGALVSSTRIRRSARTRWTSRSSASTCSRQGCSSTSWARRARLPVDPARSLGRAAADADGWFADRDIFEMDIRDYSPSPTARRFQSGTPPVPAIYAGIAGMELMQEDRPSPRPGSTSRAQRAADRGHRRAGRAVVTAARSGAARRARLCRLDRCPRARRRPRVRTASSPRTATAICASPPTPTTPPRTSTPSSPPRAASGAPAPTLIRFLNQGPSFLGGRGGSSHTPTLIRFFDQGREFLEGEAVRSSWIWFGCAESRFSLQIRCAPSTDREFLGGEAVRSS